MHEPIAYTFEADTHCPACTRERFGATCEGTDGEGNPVGAIAPWDEWQDASSLARQTLTCGTCGGIIEEYLPERERQAETERIAQALAHARSSWYFDGNTSDGLYARTLHGIEDGDSEILNLLPSFSFGEYAGESLAELLPFVDPSDPDADELQDAFLLVFDETVQRDIETAARAYLAE